MTARNRPKTPATSRAVFRLVEQRDWRVRRVLRLDEVFAPVHKEIALLRSVRVTVDGVR